MDPADETRAQDTPATEPAAPVPETGDTPPPATPESGGAPEGAEDFAAALAAAGDDYEALQEVLKRAHAADDDPAAIAVLDRMIDLRPEDTDPLLERFMLHVITDDPDAARDATLLEDRFPDKPEVLAALGEWRLRLGERERGLYDLDRAAALADGDNTLLFGIARILTDAAEIDLARPILDRLVAWKPRLIHHLRADLRKNAGDLVGARADLDAALAAPPDAEDPAYAPVSTLGVLLDRTRLNLIEHAIDAAEADLQTAQDLIAREPLPESVGAQPLVEAGNLAVQVAMERGDLDGARTGAESLTERWPDYESTWATLATVYVTQGDIERATEVLARGQEHNPASAPLLLLAALIHGEQQDFAAALADWTHLHELDPGNASTLGMRSTLHLAVGDADAARMDAEAALALDPGDPSALQTLVSLSVRNDNPIALRAALDRALAVLPDDPDYLLLRARTRVESGEVLGAAADAAHLLAQEPDNPAALSMMGHIEMLMGQPAAALRHYEAAQRVTPNSAAGFYNLAAAEAAGGRCPQAVALLRRAVAADPDFAADAEEDPNFDACRGTRGFQEALEGRAPGGGAPPRGRSRAPRGKRR